MAIGALELLAGLACLLIALYYYFTSTFDFWKSRGVAGPKPVPFFGTFKEQLLAKTYLGDYLLNVCREYKDEPLIGIFASREPILIVKDAELIKSVLIKDFSAFADRGMKVFEKVEPLSQHLFLLEHERWRPLRANLSPTFTSGKLKEMFYLLSECAEHFERYIDERVKKDPVIECRELTAKFTTDVIGVCAFGLKMNALDDEESDFRRIGRKFFDITNFKLIKMRLRDALPSVYQLLAPLMYDYEVNDFFINSFKETMEYRKLNNVKRNDFVDLLLEMQNNPDKINHIEMTDTLLASQAFVFFIAGFETSSTTISNAIYALALNQPVQDKLREEIRETLKRDNGKLTYENIKGMKYLNKVFCETLRLYSPVAALLRSALRDYTFPGTKVSIPKGTKIFIPVYAIQRDPEIYPNPEKFDPERFDEENVKQRHPSHFLPFGDGPRNCIGARFAHHQSKLGIAVIVKNYRVEVCDKTSIPYVNNPKAFLIQPIGGVVVKFTKLND